VAGNRALILDRDGVINVDHGFIHRVEQFEFIAGIFELARFATGALGWPLIVITNQSGIGRGLFGEADYEALTRWMCERFRAEQAPIARVYHCPYHPQHGIGRYRIEHPWRKPNPGMILQAAADFNLDLANSVLIGDRESDMEAAAAAGVGTRIRIDPTGAAPAPGVVVAYHTVCGLDEALAILRLQAAADGR
jgi:D-glycero-D-manno-heptose 1,7-bisphosphate phosphatase